MNTPDDFRIDTRVLRENFIVSINNNLVMEEMQAKLKPIMAQRSIAVIEDCLEKLAFLGSITPDVLAHRDELSRK